MSQIANPYFAGPPASDPKTFFGRQDVLRFVDETLASPMHNVIVFYGQRRIGKTSILHQILHRSGRDYQAVLFDLQSSLDSPAHGLFYGLAREVAGQLNLAAPDRADFQQDPDAFRTRFLPQFYDHLGDRRLLLLLDEFDALSLETAPAELDALPFVKALNRMIQSNDKQVVFLFVVGRRLKDLSSQQLQIFRGGRDRQIGLLKKEATLQLITRPAEGILTYQDAAVERIWMLTSGHPYFTQLLCQEIFNQAQRQRVRTVAESHVEAVIDDAINTGQSALQWFWDEVPPVERFTLYTIGQLETERTGVTLDQLIDRRDAQRAQIDELELRALPDQLADRQVLKRDSAQCYHFAVALVRHWIVQGHSLEEVTTELTRAAIDELAKALFETGRAAYRADDTSFAIDNFSRALSINSNYVEARLWLARAYAKAGDLLAAINEFVNVERFGGPQQREARIGLADARSQYGQQLEQEGNIEQARQEYQRTLELDPQHALANVRLSEIFRQQADEHLENEGVVTAQPFYEQALKRNPSADLEREIKERLKQYSQAQEKVNNWEEAGLARQLSAQLTSSASDEQEALLRFHLRQGHWHLSQHELETAAEVYRRVLGETAGDASRQTIENDILRYSQQQEESNNWSQAEAALTLLIELFPEDLENRRQLADSLCRQAEFYLDQDDLSRAKIAYRCALADDPANQALRNLIRAGFQSYRRARAKQNMVQVRKSVEEAMLVLVEILGREDILACQWLSEARTDLGDALRAEGRLAEAQAVYRQALEDAIHVLQLAAETDQAHHFDEAAKRTGQALVGAAPDQEMVDRIKTIFNNYRHRQEEKLRWSHARRAMEELERLFSEDEDTRFWLAETQASEAAWHLRRAIPDLDEARRLARSALDIPLSQPKADLIIDQSKKAFQTHCLQQEEANPPNWRQAEQIMNKLVSLFPGDAAVNRWLADTRLRQGDWYLTQENQSPVEAGRHLTEAAEVYKRAQRELPNDDSLITHLKRSFRDYRDRRELSDPSARSLARQAMQILADLLPNDEEVRQWLAEIEKPVPPPRRELLRKWGPIIAAVMAVVLCLSGGLVLGTGGKINNLIAAVFPEDTPTATVPSSATLTVPIPATTPATEAVVVVSSSPTPTVPPATETATPTHTAPASPTSTLTSTPTPTTTPTATPTPILSPTPYPAPQLVSPNHRTLFRGASPPPRLEWKPIEGLGLNDYYLVRLEFLRNGNPYLYSGWLKSSSWEVPIEVFHLIDPPERQIQWQVVVAQIPPGGGIEDAVELGPISETRIFTWEPILLPDSEGLDVAINPENSRQVLVVLRGIGIYKSDSGGIDWRLVSNERTIERLHIAPANAEVVYAGAFAQVLKSEDQGETWRASPIPPYAQVYAITTDPNDASIVFVATDRGIMRSGDGGQTWLPLDRAGDKGEQILDSRFYSVVAARTPWGNRVYVAGEGDQIHWRGTDDTGSPWQTQVCIVCARTIFALAIDPRDSNKLLAGSDEGGLAISRNAGYDWARTTLPPSIPTLKFPVLAFDPINPQVVYAGSGSHRNPTDGEGLYRSLDGGLTWHRFNAWAPSGEGEGTYVYGIALTPMDSQIIFIATSEGVFRSDDRGDNWIRQSDREN
jgi:Tfp pilus assembly protein PilF